jgi:hypothetical protein
MMRVCRGRDVIYQAGEIGWSAHLLQVFLLRKHISEGNQIRGVILIVKLDDSGEDLSMGFTIKVRSIEDSDDLMENFIIQQDRPENGLFSLEVLRR